MVANLSGHKRGWDERWKEFSDWAEKGKEIQNKLLKLVEEDTEAFNQILDAYGLPKNTEEENAARRSAIKKATMNATLIPFEVMETALSAFGLISEMVEKGNPASITDAAVGALALRSCIKGAFLNVRINASGLDDRDFVKNLLDKGWSIEKKAIREEEDILSKVEIYIQNTSR
jgi:glutamate formiminotransferase/formiminotetrahydrofolate cyclodeaminase